MKFAEWLHLNDNSDVFLVNGIEVRIVEILCEQIFRKFRVSWVNPNGSSAVRYVLAADKREALNMMKDDLYRATKSNLSGKIAGHGGMAKISDVAEVKGIAEVLRMLKYLLYRQRSLPLTTVDWFDVNTMLKALVNGQIADPEDVKLVKFAINTLKKRNPGLFDSRNWELLVKLKKLEQSPIKMPGLPQVGSQSRVAI